VVEAKPAPKDLIENPDDPGVNKQVPERIAPWRLPADEIAQIPAARSALESFRPAREDVPCATLVVRAIDGSKVVVVIDGSVAGSHLLRRQDSLQRRAPHSEAVRPAGLRASGDAEAGAGGQRPRAADGSSPGPASCWWAGEQARGRTLRWMKPWMSNRYFSASFISDQPPNTRVYRANRCGAAIASATARGAAAWVTRFAYANRPAGRTIVLLIR
jgi:hypothetical protein